MLRTDPANLISIYTDESYTNDPYKRLRWEKVFLLSVFGYKILWNKKFGGFFLQK